MILNSVKQSLINDWNDEYNNQHCWIWQKHIRSRCQSFLTCHFLQAVVLSAWTWQICLCAPCFLSFHSHSMTNVKRISSLHESSHSTRTKRVSRMAVIPTVSKLADTHVLPRRASVSVTCRADRGFAGVFQAQRLRGGLSCFLSWFPVGFVFFLFLLCHSQIYSASGADQSAGEKPSQCCSFSRDMSPYGDIVRPSFPSESSSARSQPSSMLSCYIWRPLLAAQCLDRDRSVGVQLPPFLASNLLLMLRLSSFLSFFCSGTLWTANRTSWG